MAQYHGNFDGYSAHVYVDDKSAYQAMPYSRGAWHVGVNYGERLFGTVNNRNSVGIEMCVQAGFDYDKAFANTAEVCRQLMSELNIPADRVVQHSTMMYAPKTVLPLSVQKMTGTVLKS